MFCFVADSGSARQARVKVTFLAKGSSQGTSVVATTFAPGQRVTGSTSKRITTDSTLCAGNHESMTTLTCGSFVPTEW